MGDQRRSMPFEPSGGKGKPVKTAPQRAGRQARRVAVFTGLPTLAGMGVFIGSYLLITRGIADIAPGTTLAASGFCFLLGLGGLSFGVLSASWESDNGSLLGFENIGTNLKRLRASIKAQKTKPSD